MLHFYCLQIITGPVMVAGDHKFHPECFCCKLCNTYIGDGDSYALVERSKLYWYVFTLIDVIMYFVSLYAACLYKQKRISRCESWRDCIRTAFLYNNVTSSLAGCNVNVVLLCSGQCYRRQMQPLSRSTNSQNNSIPPHSIRLVEIPWTKGSKGGIRLSVDENQKGVPISSGAGCPGVRISE